MDGATINDIAFAIMAMAIRKTLESNQDPALSKKRGLLVRGDFPVNISWNTFWDVKVDHTDYGWQAEMRIQKDSTTKVAAQFYADSLAIQLVELDKVMK